MSVLTDAKNQLLTDLCAGALLGYRQNGTPSVSDDTSADIGRDFLTRLAPPYQLANPSTASANSIGARFTDYVESFLQTCLKSPAARDLRDEDWKFGRGKIYAGRQYAHLSVLERLDKDPGRLQVDAEPASARARATTVARLAHRAKEEQRQLEVLLHSEYIVQADLLVLLPPKADSELTRKPSGDKRLVDDADLAFVRSPLASRTGAIPFCHANVSCKFTLRNDRGQNVRTESLQMARQRRGPMPRMVVATAEVWPGRLESLGKGTGEIDCVYHIHLEHLIAAVDAVGGDDAQRQLELLVRADRLRDILDLPLDLLR